MKIDQIQVDKPFRGYLFIRDAAVRTSKNGSQFIKLVLSDTDYNEVTGFLWNVGKEETESFTQGTLVAVIGKGKSFNDNLQLDIQKIRRTNEGDSVTLADFIETAPEEPEAMYEEILETVEDFGNEDIKKVTRRALKDRESEILYFPAAKSVHHAMRSGLLYHTLSMLRTAKELAKLYPGLNEDLLYAGVILHDLGKIDEMVSDQNGVVEDYSDKGKLLGHITSQINEIDGLCKELGVGEEVAMVLEHMILSHHYEPEYGSPVRPMFPEAELLHHIDMIDARMNSMQKIQRSLEPGTFSERQPMLNNIKIYKPNL